MPIRHGGIAATRASIWPRDHFCRRTIAPRWSSPTTWNEFLPISMPMVAMVAIDLLDMAVLRLTLAPSQHHSPVGQEHGRTIPLERWLFDHPVGGGQQRPRHPQNQPLTGPQFDEPVQTCRLHHRQVGGLVALENAPDIDAGLPQ